MPTITETWVRLLQSSNELTGRLAEMTAASVYVVARRNQLFVFGSNTSRKRQECARMVFEKFEGGGEFVVATWRALTENYPLMAGSIAPPMNIGIFISTVSLQSMAPLHKRVIGNMKRLSH